MIWSRIDHFHGLHLLVHPPERKHALRATGNQYPGQALLNYLSAEVPKLELIAEDLGDLDESTWEFIARLRPPGHEDPGLRL